MEEFGAYLVSNGVFDTSAVDEVSSMGAVSSEPLYYRLLRKHPGREEAIWGALSTFLQTSLLDRVEGPVDVELARLLPARLAHEYAVVPIGRTGDCLEVAVADPRQFEKCDELSMLLAQEAPVGGGFGVSLTVSPHLARPSDVAAMIRSLYGIGAETIQEMLEAEESGSSGGESPVSLAGAGVVDLEGSETEGEDAAIIRFVNQLMLEAVKIGASDIHLEPFEQELRVRYRVDGVLQVEPVPERIKNLESAIISRVKIMSNLDIAEKRLPQDGQIRLTVMGRPIDVRVSVLPTMYGQGVALRLLDQQTTFRRLDNLGLASGFMGLYRELLRLPHGVILVTGPTGSGKSTTLYASLNEINDPSRKIVTVEDPVEYQLGGVTQMQVKPAIGLTFSRLLRSILRHDPDVVMVGEIRDADTAKIAVSAAMTGHLVFSTLHTNDAPSAPVRLLEMGVEPYLVSSALEAVVAQRLVRLLCPECSEAVSVSGVLAPEDETITEEGVVYESHGCGSCRQTGFAGRTAIFEMFCLNDAIRQLILNRANAGQIRQEALRMGMQTLRQSGLEKVASGMTSLAEVYRVAREEAVDMRGWLENLKDSQESGETSLLFPDWEEYV